MNKKVQKGIIILMIVLMGIGAVGTGVSMMTTPKVQTWGSE